VRLTTIPESILAPLKLEGYTPPSIFKELSLPESRGSCQSNQCSHGSESLLSAVYENRIADSSPADVAAVGAVTELDASQGLPSAGSKTAPAEGIVD
jgi:hypothetical protein